MDRTEIAKLIDQVQKTQVKVNEARSKADQALWAANQAQSQLIQADQELQELLRTLAGAWKKAE